MVRLQTLDLRIGVRVPASQPHILNGFRTVRCVLQGFVAAVLWIPAVATCKWHKEPIPERYVRS